MALAKYIVTALFIIFLIVFTIIRYRNCEGKDTSGVDDLNNTIEQLSKTNRELKDIIERRDRTIGDLQKSNTELARSIERATKETIGAGTDLSDAFGTVERIRRLSQEINN